MKKTILALSAALTLAVACAAPGKKSHDMAVMHNLNTFNTIVNLMETNYVDSVRTDEAFKAAIEAMLGTIDPYTEYYTREETEGLRNMTTGEYAGIGSYIMTRDGITYISQPMAGSPAAKAGLRPGDKIVRVDTTDVVNPRGQNVSKLLKGPAGTTVSVTVERPWASAQGDTAVMTLDILREKVQQPSVPYFGMLDDGKTGYVMLTSYIDKSPDEMAEALKSLRDAGMTGLILDLRGNGGGLVESAVDILGQFLPKGTQVLQTKGRGGVERKTYRTAHKPILPDMPVAVLIDGGSASAAEITAGALQDLDRAVLVGTRSFGKGLVQGTLPLPYEGLLKITTAKYYIPSGRLIQALDYSRRNPDGSVAPTPDSLANVFRTRNGREVRDGGGLQPDTTLTWPNPSALLRQLIMDQKIFDYATRYVATHPDTPDPDTFSIDDDTYAQFSAGIDTVGFNYERRCSVLMDHLKEALRDEGYMDEATAAQIDTLDMLLRHDLRTDLRLKREEISDYLAEEILQRYHGEPGRIRYAIRHDPGVDAARDILADPKRIGRMLGRD